MLGKEQTGNGKGKDWAIDNLEMDQRWDLSHIRASTRTLDRHHHLLEKKGKDQDQDLEVEWELLVNRHNSQAHLLHQLHAVQIWYGLLQRKPPIA